MFFGIVRRFFVRQEADRYKTYVVAWCAFRMLGEFNIKDNNLLVAHFSLIVPDLTILLLLLLLQPLLNRDAQPEIHGFC